MKLALQILAADVTSCEYRGGSRAKSTNSLHPKNEGGLAVYAELGIMQSIFRSAARRHTLGEARESRSPRR